MTRAFPGSGVQSGILRDPIALMLVLVSAALLLTLTACSRISQPEGGSGGVVVGDTLYIGTSGGEVIALYIGSEEGQTIPGERLWRFSPIDEENDQAFYGTPAVSGETLYLGGYNGVLYALSLETGSGGDVMWQEPLSSPIVGGPVIAGDMLLIGSSDGNLFAFDVTDSSEVSEVWRFTTGGKIWSTPAVDDEVVYFGSLDHYLYAVGLTDGREIWRFETGGAITSTPVVARGHVFVGSFDGVFYSVDIETGQSSWQFEGANNWYWGDPITHGDTIYAPSLDGNLYALAMDTGRQLWTLETEGVIVGAPAITGDDLIAVPSSAGGKSKIQLASLEGGVLRGACSIDADIMTPLVEHNGFIYFGAQDSTIRALHIKSNGNPDEEWVHFTDQEEPSEVDRTPAC